ncbi:MAG TPA: HEAT repeat domain-containing protein, partial [Anaeromyxobacter sp.]
MGVSPVVALLAALAFSALADPQIDAAIRALRKDSSLKVRTQAAIVLGQRNAPEAVQALREAVAEDGAASVRIAAVTALAKIGDRRARPTLRHASAADPDDAVRRAAARALAGFGPLSFDIEEPEGPSSVRGPFREMLVRRLKSLGFSVSDRGDLRAKPAVKLEVEEGDGKTVISVRTSLAVVDGDGRVELMEAGARATVSGAVPDHKVGGYSA